MLGSFSQFRNGLPVRMAVVECGGGLGGALTSALEGLVCGVPTTNGGEGHTPFIVLLHGVEVRRLTDEPDGMRLELRTTTGTAPDGEPCTVSTRLELLRTLTLAEATGARAAGQEVVATALVTYQHGERLVAGPALENLGVKAKFRRHGLGRLLFGETLRFLRGATRLGVGEGAVLTLSHVTGGRDFFEAVGAIWCDELREEGHVVLEHDENGEPPRLNIF